MKKTGLASERIAKKPAVNPAARRLEAFSESVIREQTRLCLEYGSVNLAQGFPDFPCPPELKRFARNAVTLDQNQYSITWGMPELRQSLAAKAKRYNGISAHADSEVTVTCGSTEAMICAFLGLVDPGREVILFQPFYENYHPDSYLSGAKPVYVNLRAPDWHFDENDLRRAFNKNTAAVVITTPHNPTGKVFSKSELQMISKLCQKWGALVFSDEIYEHILYDGAKHVSPASVSGLEDKTVTIGSASKTYGVTGWRVGWAIASGPLTQAMRKVHDFLTVCAATPLQVAVHGALGLPDDYYSDLGEQYQVRRDFLINALEAVGFKCFRPKGAYYVMAEAGAFLKGDQKNDVALARHLVSKIGVAVVPGSSFYRPGNGARNDLLRFCFCKRMETLAAASERLKKLRN